MLTLLIARGRRPGALSCTVAEADGLRAARQVSHISGSQQHYQRSEECWRNYKRRGSRRCLQQIGFNVR